MFVKHGSLLLFLNCIPFVVLLKYEKPVAEKLWRQRCVRNSHVLNDCNWCWCNSNFKYTCNARVCGEVDMFGHFNDAIQDIDVGMEGHGVWRTTPSACEPGVHYQRGALLCICTEDGIWPNPVCRDTFRVLHPVEVINDLKLSKTQKCSPTKLYSVDCNVCFCPPTGYIDPSLCTDKKCTKSNLISTRSDDQIDEVYAPCDVNKQYKLGCQSCICLKNNRLQCGNCTKESQCKGKRPGDNFKVDCNTCHCDKKGTIYCTVNRCLDNKEEITKLKISQPQFQPTRRPINDIDCEPGTKFEKDCNTCYCFQKKGNIKKYGCTIKKCHREDSVEECKIGDKFTKHCELCHCGIYKGNTIEICQSDPKCDKRYRESMRRRVYDVQRDCEPLQIYENDCNTCQCLQDGKTLKCTDEPCDEKPISIDIIPIGVNSLHCPQGKSYKIECNYCVCLPNGNAFCTTMDCQIQN